MLALLATADGPHTPQRWSPVLWSFLAAAIAAEQARRDGRHEDEPALPLAELDAAELERAFLSATAALDSQKRVLPELMQAEAGRPLTADEELIRSELTAFFRALVADLLLLRRHTPAASETKH